jgi:hypothetical protein
MKKIKFCCLFIILKTSSFINAQTNSIHENPWVLGLGINVVYNPGTLFNGMLDIKNNYNYSYPIRISLEKRFMKNYGFEVAGNFNTFLKGKTIDGIKIEDDVSFFSIDGTFKYYITNIYQNVYRAIYEGYIATGVGNNFYDKSYGGMTANLGGGINLYISENFRFNGQAMAKISIDNNPKRTNYIHYNIGFIIRLQDSFFN